MKKLLLRILGFNTPSDHIDYILNEFKKFKGYKLFDVIDKKDADMFIYMMENHLEIHNKVLDSPYFKDKH